MYFYIMGDKTEPLLLLHFQATWCEPCKWSEPVMEQVLRHFGDRIVLEKIDIDQFPERAREFHVLSVPTFVLLRDRKEIWRYRGFDSAPAMIRMMEPLLSV